MKKVYPVLFFLFLLLAGLSSCQKEEGVDNSISAQDHNNIITATDATVNDATSAAGQVKGLSGKTDGGLQVLCGSASVDTGNGRGVTISYDGTTACKGIIRGGKVTISIISGPFWKDEYAKLQIVFNQLTLTNALTGSAYTINGTYVITNETGGLAWRVSAGLDQNTSVKHRVQASGANITFPNGAKRVWSVDRTLQYTSLVSNSSNVITVTASSENTGNEETWGIDRNGDNFKSYLISPVTSNNNINCNFKPYQGEYSQVVGGKSVDILYGVDDNGNPLNNAADCAYGYKITYTNGKKILTKIVAYIF